MLRSGAEGLEVPGGFVRDVVVVFAPGASVLVPLEAALGVIEPVAAVARSVGHRRRQQRVRAPVPVHFVG